jgi:surfeit locus 1 family protein
VTRRMIAPLLFGLIGIAVLIGLGVWQLQRLEWKTGVLARIEARISAEPVEIPPAPDEASDQYRRVRASGRTGAGEIHVYTANASGAVGYRVIAPFTLGDGRMILLDRGFVPLAAKDAPREIGPAEVEGSLLWPDDGASESSPPDLEKNIWITRDVSSVAAALGTLPVLLVVETSQPAGGPAPLPVTINIPNNHLDYALTWFGLALAWAGMTLYLLWRIKRRID